MDKNNKLTFSDISWKIFGNDFSEHFKNIVSGWLKCLDCYDMYMLM